MTSWRCRVAVSVVWLLAFATCKKDRELPPGLGPQGPAVDVDKLQAPALFAHIPADTPYVVASFEAMPLDYYAKVKRAVGPALARAVDQLRGLDEDGEVDRWIDAVTGELAGKWSAKGLEALGLSARPRFALYGHGAAPAVLRVEVKDSKAVLATVERIAHKAGAQLPALETRHGREFWRIELPGDSGAIVALTDDQLVFAVGPRRGIAAALPQIVGAERPSRNMADGKQLKDAISRHRLGPVMIGYVDGERLASALIALADRSLPSSCTAEIDRLAAQAPRFVFGYREFTDTRYAGGAILELARPLVEQLKALRTAVPGLPAALAGEPLLAIGGGVDLARGTVVGEAVAAALRDLGEACEADELVRAGRGLREALSGSLPGPLAKLAGGALAIDAIDLGGRGQGYAPAIPRQVDGFAMLATSDAKAVFEAIADELPPLRGLGVKANGKLHGVELTKFGLPFDVHGGVGQEVIAVASGARGKRRAEQALAATGGRKAPLLAGTLDMGKLMALQAQLDPDNDTRDLDESLGAIFGRATFSVDVTDAGLVMWMSGELK